MAKRMKFSVVGLPHYTIWHLYEPSADDIRHMEEMERERKQKEQEEKDKQERLKKINDQFDNPSSQWDKDREELKKIKENAEKAKKEAGKAEEEVETAEEEVEKAEKGTKKTQKVVDDDTVERVGGKKNPKKATDADKPAKPRKKVTEDIDESKADPAE
jgi:mannan polymerase II complex ANP1 subunit